MKAKVLVLACLVGLLSASVVLAQEKGGKGAAGGRMDGVISQLNLDAKQQAEVTKLREQMRADVEKAGTDKEAKHQAYTNFRTKLMEILTPEQKQKFEELMPKRGQHGGAAAGGEKKGEAPK